ncbi:MerR family transcriptional regulator [Candidatus Dojkabacteria bacterium]|uniref:MerR family transcriptional regulator n=1 Tax=Candidatus Dojkabacteria bacterium TaxID=2099670 RepID=A0A955HYI1_9BACT|nr:MerR family transcriptional regulator [Candidatus Dojkabacteria bacterium]
MAVIERKDLLSTGEFAKLARTTKRTVQFYDKEGILQPAFTDGKDYRFYKPEQIIDFQAILLLRKLNVSLEEIKKLLGKSTSLNELFKKKQRLINDEIKKLERIRKNTMEYYKNMEKNGLLVAPKIKRIKSYTILCIERHGTYTNIKAFVEDLMGMLANIPENAVYFTMFMDRGYKPKGAKMKIGIVKKGSVEVKDDYRSEVKEMKIPEYIGVTYTHKGSPELLSLLWKEMSKYLEKTGLKRSYEFCQDLELYHWNSFHGEKELDEMVFELSVPVKRA